MAQVPLIRIALLSAFILFVEMLLVRWVGTELRVFAYLQNGVLITAFLGLGLGARNSRQPVYLLGAVLSLAAITLVILDPLGFQIGEAVTQGLIGFQDSEVWYAVIGQPPYVRTALVTFSLVVSLAILAAVAWAFRPLGQWLGAWMDTCPRPIAAYTANIVGSLVGIAAFVGATVLRTPPRLWMLVCGVGFAVLASIAADRPRHRALTVVVALALPLLTAPADSLTFWSPYQKLQIVPHKDASGTVCGEQILVNGVGYQGMINLDPAHMAAHPNLYPPGSERTSNYVLPHNLVGPRERVLVVGSGSGNDVAGALRAGSTSVRAVEIDPVIVELGRQRHPERPYSSPRVEVVVDDARAFFGKDQGGPYDLVWFGLLDSHTTPSAYANVRLDHFVYTRESFAAMREHLAPDGVVVLYFATQTPWMAARLAALLQDTFGTPPLVLPLQPSNACVGWGGLLMVAGSREAVAGLWQRAAADPTLRPIDVSSWKRPTPTTDDWPYLYLERPSLPSYHLLIAVASLVVAGLLRRRLFAEGERSDVAMLLLGMGFMLLEVAGVSRAVLLFGTTWTVNAYVVGAILGMILLANLVASRIHIDPAGWPAAGLLVALLAHALLPTSLLAALPLGARIVLGAGFLALPVFFSGLIFVSVWASAERKDLALGSNLLGSLLGGIASMLSMAVGFRALAFLTIAAYLGALLALRRRPAISAPTSAA